MCTTVFYTIYSQWYIENFPLKNQYSSILALAVFSTSIPHIMKNFISVFFTYEHVFTFISIRTLTTLLYLLNAIIDSDCQQNDQSNNSSKGQSCELINLTWTPNHLDNNFFIWAPYVLTHWFISAESKFYNIYIWENQN